MLVRTELRSVMSTRLSCLALSSFLMAVSVGQAAEPPASKITLDSDTKLEMINADTRSGWNIAAATLCTLSHCRATSTR